MEQESQEPSPSFLSSLKQWILSKVKNFLLWVLAFGPVPSHVAFIMDGNRRYADSLSLARRTGHELGYGSLLRNLRDCFCLGIRVVTIYAFSVDNFRRPPEEVSTLLGLMCAKLHALAEEEPFLKEYSIRVRVLGDLSLLPEDVRQAADRAMLATEKNAGPTLNICVAYSSVGEITRAIQKVRDETLEMLKIDYWTRLDGPFKEAFGAVQNAQDKTLETRLQTCLDDPVKEALNEQQKVQNETFETLETHHRTSLNDPVKEALSEQQKVQDQPFKTLKTHHQSSLDRPVKETPSQKQKAQDETFKTLETHHWARLDDPAKEPLSAIPKLQDETLETKNLHRTHLDGPIKEAFSKQQKVQEETCKTLETRHQTCLDDRIKESLSAIQDKIHKTLHWTRLHCPVEEALIGVVPERIEEHLYTFPNAPPDLLIRTSGETRLSDFLLWQTSFSHLVFCKVLWPDLSLRHLFWIILDYQKAYPRIMEHKRSLAKRMD